MDEIDRLLFDVLKCHFIAENPIEDHVPLINGCNKNEVNYYPPIALLAPYQTLGLFHFNEGGFLDMNEFDLHLS